MPKDITVRQQFETQLATLVDKFAKHHDEYMRAEYSETEVRAEFIDQFFRALGWDVYNDAERSPKMREVFREAGETHGRVDYVFRIDNRDVFYVEAKAPRVPIDRADVVMQVKRYAWHSPNVFIAAVTDFEEFRLYDATAKPDRKHPNTGLIFEYHYRDYLKPKTLDDLWLLSRESVGAGSIDRLIKKSSVQARQRIAVDQAFLDDLSAWREQLAKAVFKATPELSPADLNSVVQVFLDRLIFIRICEDRRIMDPRQLAEVAENWEHSGKRASMTNDLNALFHAVNDRLNGEIFKPHRCEKIDWDINAALVADIIKNLYFPASPYLFDKIPVELLGSIYERYLGKTIRVTETRAIVEEKPEVRKAGGVYYTPKYIVDYIVAQTVGKLIEGKTPKQIEKLKILDPACGSGSFLLGAYRALLDYHTRYFSERASRRSSGGGNGGNGGQASLLREERAEYGEFKLSLEQKAQILRNNIFGVDIDPQAVEITMMSLYIKMLEGERGIIAGRALLPRLKDNIKLGNSLVAHDIGNLSPDDAERIKPFTWNSDREGFGEIMAAGGFDAVIGNPPYGADLRSVETSYLLSKFKLQDYQLDTYLLFMEKAFALLKSKGLFGMIIPNTWLLNLQSNRIRQYIFHQMKVENIVHFRRRVFAQATVDTEIHILRNDLPTNTSKIQITLVEKDDHKIEYAISQARWKTGNGKPVNILERPELVELADKLRTQQMLDGICMITQGAKPFQVGKGKPPQTRKIVDEKSFVAEKKRNSTFRPLLRGSLIQRYAILWRKNYWISFGDWLAEPRYSANYDMPAKIVIRQTGDSLVATLDREQFIVRDNLYTIVPRDANFDLHYALGLLNSRLLNWFYQTIVNPEQGEALAQVKRGHLAQLPIRAINFANPADKARHDKMVARVERMLKLHKQKQSTKSDAARERIEREINVTDEQIDVLVYELYGLTKEEIQIVEEK